MKECKLQSKYVLMIDPTPGGWVYGFPKALPQHAVGGSGTDLFVLESFNLTMWVTAHGYPKKQFQHYRLFVQEVDDIDEQYKATGTYLKE